QSLWAKDNNVQTSKAVGQQTGMIASAFEHRIPELFFTSEQNPGEAVSAVKALAIAAQQGDRIYQITSANIGVLDGLNIGAQVKDEIRSAAATGKETTVSGNTITVAGWTGVGYIISDPDTGAGAYRISGGVNGGFWAGLTGSAAVIFFSMGIAGAGPMIGFISLGSWIIAILGIIAIMSILESLFRINSEPDATFLDFISGF
ncbi:MAG: hypothetical protein GY869_04830, partial [Planctomycetes bacterium]|nr:hypothetical protein [Planctomycetota bacterium]